MATTVEAHDAIAQGDPSQHDGCVVERAALAVILGSFVASWRQRHPVGNDPAQRGQARRREVEMGALAWLQEEIARREPEGPPVTREMLNNILRSDSPKRPAKKFVELRYADRIVTTIGDTSAFHDGRLAVRANPRARRPLQMSCCRGNGFQDALEGRPPSCPPAPDLARSYRAGYLEATASQVALTGAAQLRGRATSPRARP